MMMALDLRLFELGLLPLRLITAMFALECLGLLTGRLLKLSKAQR